MFDCIIYLLGFLLVLAGLEALIIIFLLIRSWQKKYPNLKHEHDIHVGLVKRRIERGSNHD